MCEREREREREREYLRDASERLRESLRKQREDEVARKGVVEGGV